MRTVRLPITAVILTTGIAWPVAGAAAPPDLDAEATLVHDRWQTFTTDDGLPHDDVLALRAAGDTVWVGTAGGLARYEDDTWTSWTVEDGLPAASVSAIDIDPSTRDVWLGTWGGGLIRFTGGRFDRFGQLDSGLAGDLVFAVVADGNRVWAATNGGLSAYDLRADRWDLHFERRGDIEETAITGLCVANSRLYGAAWCGGVWQHHIADGSWNLLAAEDTTLGIAAAGGSLWCATRDRLLQRDAAGQWRALARPGPGAAGGLVTSVEAADDDTVYLGTDDGLQVLTDRTTGTWVTHARHGSGPGGSITLVRNGANLGMRASSPGLPDDRVRCVAVQGNDVWVGTAAGLARATHRAPWADLLDPAAPAAPEAGGVEPPLPDPVRIGILRPGERMIGVPGARSAEHPRLRWVDMMAVNLALEHANARGGYRGQVPFALATGPQGWFKGWGWTTPEDDFPQLARQRDVMGIVAHLGAGSRLTTAVAWRTEVPVVNFAPTAPTIDETINPWVFRCRGDEPQLHDLLLEYLFEHLGCARVAVLRDTGFPDQVRLDWSKSGTAARGQAIVADLACDVAVGGFEPALRTVAERNADVVLTWSDAAGSAAIVRTMRRAGMDQLVVGSGAIMSDEFLSRAGPAPGPVVAAGPWVAPPHPAEARFADDYLQRFRRPPTPGAYRVYVAVNHLLAAVNAAGPDRRAVRRVLDGMSRDIDGERHGEPVPVEPDMVILGHLRGGAWDLRTISDLQASTP